MRRVHGSNRLAALLLVAASAGCADAHGPAEACGSSLEALECPAEPRQGRPSFVCGQPDGSGALSRVEIAVRDGDPDAWGCELKSFENGTAIFKLLECVGADGGDRAACPLPREAAIERVVFEDRPNASYVEPPEYGVAEFGALGPAGGCLDLPLEEAEYVAAPFDDPQELCFNGEQVACGGPVLFQLRGSGYCSACPQGVSAFATCRIQQQGRDLYVESQRVDFETRTGVLGADPGTTAHCAFRPEAPGRYRVWLAGRDEPVVIRVGSDPAEPGEVCIPL